MTSGWQSSTLTSVDETLNVLIDLQGRRWQCRGQSKCYDNLFPSMDRGARQSLSRLEKLRLERESIDLFRSTARYYSDESERIAAAGDRRHYHLDLNKDIDDLEKLARKARSKTMLKKLQAGIRRVWRNGRKYEGEGEFNKILKRLYRLAGLAGLDTFRSRAQQDILEDPALVGRVADYYRCTGSVDEYLDFVEELFSNPEQIYPDVNIALCESLLRIEPEPAQLNRVRELSRGLLEPKPDFPGIEDCAAMAPLLLLRYGDANSRRLLKRVMENRRHTRSRGVVRAAAAVYSSYGQGSFQDVRSIAGALLRNHLSTLIRMVDEIKKYKEVPNRFKNRIRLATDSVAGTKFVDMRVILSLRLLFLNEKPSVRLWISNWVKQTTKESISNYDRVAVETAAKSVMSMIFHIYVFSPRVDE